jgi:hypothetical protein
MKEPTRIDFKTGKFTANGHQYYIADYLPVGRDLQYTMMVPKLSFGADFKGIFELITKHYRLATEGESPLRAIHEIAVSSMNALDGIKRLNEKDRYPVYYELCALFINREDEDPATISESQIQEKIQDWKTEGIPREDFFVLAINSIRGLTSAWQQLNEEIAKAQTATKPAK